MAIHDKEPLIPASQSLPELTIKVVIFSIILAALLAASNAYLALKMGQTISASIPASVVAIGVLRLFKQHNVLECNLIQTAASAGEGIAAAVGFILPAMIVLHVWVGFPYWQTFFITALGGLIGVLISIPLRRVMLSMPTLRFPEGTAVGNVLRITSASGGTQVRLMAQGAGVGALFSLFKTGFHFISDRIDAFASVGGAVFGVSIGFDTAMLAAGYIVGFQVGASLLLGLIFGWLIVLPYISLHYGLPSGATVYAQVMGLWENYLRYVGVGTMLVGGVWTLIRLVRPVIQGLAVGFKGIGLSFKPQHHKIERTERDIPLVYVILGFFVLMVVVYFTLNYFAMAYHIVPLQGFFHPLTVSSFFYVLVMGIVVSTICGYFSGLIGSSNNPLSGLIIISIIVLGIVLYFVVGDQPGEKNTLIAAMMVVILTIVASAAVISNENLQDLKAGQMVGATPWKQQVTLGIGVIVSCAVIAPVLDLLFQAYGMAGVYPRPGMNPANMLAAPQASLITAIITGIRTWNLNWFMIAIGGVIAVIVIIADEILKHYHWRIPALAVGLGIYLPPFIMMPIILGSVINLLVKRKMGRPKLREEKLKHQSLQQRGILLACGLVAGSALMGVLLAVPFVIYGNSDVWALVSDTFRHSVGSVIGLLAFIAIGYWLYKVCFPKQVSSKQV